MVIAYTILKSLRTYPDWQTTNQEISAPHQELPIVNPSLLVLFRVRKLLILEEQIAYQDVRTAYPGLPSAHQAALGYPLKAGHF